MSESEKIVQDDIFLIASLYNGRCEIESVVYSSYDDATEHLDDASGKNPIIIGLTVKVPKSAFEPKLQLEIDIPAEAFEKKPIQAELNEVSIPIELNGNKTTAKVKETLEDGNGAGIIAFLKKIFKG